MTGQLNIFTNITCYLCGNNPGLDPRNPLLWYGFFDAAVKKDVCWECREQHYNVKPKPKL